MQQQIQNLKDSELTQVLADGFAVLYHRKPKFPVTYLANYLKNYQFSQTQKKKMSEKIAQNQKLTDQMAAKQKQLKNKQKRKQQQKKKKEDEQKQFLDKISKTQYHEDILNYFCDWIETRFGLTGAYIGELKNRKKKVNLAEDDSQQSHIDAEAPKLIYFQNSSASHADIMLNKTLPLQSVLGRLLTAPAEGEQPPAQGEEGVVKQVKPKDQIFFPSVVDNKQLHFFRFPKLGSFFGIGIKVNSYLSNKLFDENAQKIFTYQKEHEQYEKLRQERETKFREAYDEKANGGADEQQLQSMEKQFEKQEALIQKPKLKQFDTIKRQFVFGFDTLGQDRQLSKQEQVKIKEYVNHLKKSWENAQLQGLKSDIDRHLRLADKIEAPHQDTYLKIIGEEDKQVLNNEEVEKYKSNEKLMQLQMDTARIDKLKEYLNDEKYEPFLDEILSSKVLKFQEIIKFWLIFTGKKKEEITYPGTNVLDYRKVKPFLTKDQFTTKISQFILRGSKPESKFENYAKWERQQRNLQKIDPSNVAAYNIYLAFILRFLQLAAKVRKGDRAKRINIMKQQRKARNGRKRQNEKKIKQRQAKLAALVAESEQKQQAFDQQAWLAAYNEAEQNQLHDVGPQILDEIDRDLQNGEQIIPDEVEPVQGQNPPAE